MNTRPGMSRRRFLGRGAALGLGIAGASQLSGLLRALPARAATPFTSPLTLPPVITDPAITLTAAPADVQLLPGQATKMWTFNGSFPGPLIRRPSGQPTTLTIVHQLPQAGDLTIHHHGNHSSPDSDGQPRPEVMIAPGTQRTYSYDMLIDGDPEPAAQRWYHDHSHPNTTRNTWMGLLGLFILDDDFDAAMPFPSGAYELPLIISDRTFDANNQLVDPWLVAQVVIESTEKLCPLVAVQPVYMHPYTAANMVSSFAHIYGRRIFLNMVAGGFRNDLLALGDPTEHADRYARVVDYTQLVKRLLSGERVSASGRYYTVKNLTLTPKLPPELFPGIFVSGSSEDGVAAARAIGATAVKYPKPPHEEISTSADGAGIGMRVGVIARDDESEAWKVARARFPEDRKGQVTHGLAMKVFAEGVADAADVHALWQIGVDGVTGPWASAQRAELVG